MIFQTHSEYIKEVSPMSFSMEIRNVSHDAAVHDPDEVFRDGFMAGIFARNPYEPDTAEYHNWRNGHNLTNRRAKRIKRWSYWLKFSTHQIHRHL